MRRAKAIQSLFRAQCWYALYLSVIRRYASPNLLCRLVKHPKTPPTALQKAWFFTGLFWDKKSPNPPSLMADSIKPYPYAIASWASILTQNCLIESSNVLPLLKSPVPVQYQVPLAVNTPFWTLSDQTEQHLNLLLASSTVLTTTQLILNRAVGLQRQNWSANNSASTLRNAFL